MLITQRSVEPCPACEDDTRRIDFPFDSSPLLRHCELKLIIDIEVILSDMAAHTLEMKPLLSVVAMLSNILGEAFHSCQS